MKLSHLGYFILSVCVPLAFLAGVDRSVLLTAMAFGVALVVHLVAVVLFLRGGRP